MKNSKGFTLIELLAVVMILGILLSFAALSYSSYLSRGRKKAFDIAINSFEDAAVSALDDCSTLSKENLNKLNPNKIEFCNSHKIPDVGETIEIKLSDLVKNNYIDPIMSPYDTKIECGTDSEGNYSYTRLTRKEVEVYRYNYDENGNMIGKSLGSDDSNISYDYETYLVCGNKKELKVTKNNED